MEYDYYEAMKRKWFKGLLKTGNYMNLE
jgi:hypothetical protein